MSSYTPIQVQHTSQIGFTNRVAHLVTDSSLTERDVRIVGIRDTHIELRKPDRWRLSRCRQIDSGLLGRAPGSSNLQVFSMCHLR